MFTVCVSCFRLVTEVTQLFISSQKSRLLKRLMQFISFNYFCLLCEKRPFYSNHFSIVIVVRKFISEKCCQQGDSHCNSLKILNSQIVHVILVKLEFFFDLNHRRFKSSWFLG